MPGFAYGHDADGKSSVTNLLPNGGLFHGDESHGTIRKNSHKKQECWYIPYMAIKHQPDLAIYIYIYTQ